MSTCFAAMPWSSLETGRVRLHRRNLRQPSISPPLEKLSLLQEAHQSLRRTLLRSFPRH